MAVHNVRLLKKEEIAKGTMAFHFEKPDDFVFVPGQYADLTILDPMETDQEGNIRTFSIASAPFDPDLVFATRMRDTAFKRELGKMPEGTAIELDGPYGSFTLHARTERPAVFIAGGIGITPFRSILRTAGEEKPERKFYLFYSDHTKNDTAFFDELSRLTGEIPDFTFVPVMSDTEGYITDQTIRKHVERIDGPIYYLAGPPAMVAGMREMLARLGISEDDIRFEEFAGY